MSHLYNCNIRVELYILPAPSIGMLYLFVNTFVIGSTAVGWVTFVSVLSIY